MIDNLFKAEPNRNSDINRPIRPTLFIALGGAGKEVLLRIRQRILREGWNGHPVTDLSKFLVASFLYCDDDCSEPSITTPYRSRSNNFAENAGILDRSEKLQRRIDVLHYLKNLDQYPHIKEWLPRSDLINLAGSHTAAHGIRAVSRLWFFDQYSSFRALVENKAKELVSNVSQVKSNHHGSFRFDGRIRVVVVCSSAGGFGSGTFIDVGLAINSMKNLPLARVDLVLTLPSFLRKEVYSRSGPNTFAALMELETTMRDESRSVYVTRWDETSVPDGSKPPFDNIYLIDSINAVEESLPYSDGIFDMIAATLTEGLGVSDFSLHQNRISSATMLQYRIHPYYPFFPEPYPTCRTYSMDYSSFGMATIETVAHLKLEIAVTECCVEITRVLLGGESAEAGGGQLVGEQVIQSLNNEVNLQRAKITRGNHGTQILLPNPDLDCKSVALFVPQELDRWSQEFSTVESGAAALHLKLTDENQLCSLILRMKAFVMDKFGQRGIRPPTIHDILLMMSAQERIELFRDAINKAMPWIYIDNNSASQNRELSHHYRLLIGADNEGRFWRDFRDEIKTALPSDRLGLAGYQVAASGYDHKIVFYSEFSGFPLDFIQPVRGEWREAYIMYKRKWDDRPLHNHKDASRFADPVVPTTEELKRAYDMMGLFLRAVAFGILHRREGADGVYELDLSEHQDGDWASVGTERDIRSSGFAASHQEIIRSKLGRFLDQLTPIQLAAAAALMGWTARRAYAPKMAKIRENWEQRVPGLASLVASDQAKSLLDRVGTQSRAFKLKHPAEAVRLLRDNIERWTIEIPGSVNDVDPIEVNVSSGETEASRAKNKRKIVPEHFSDAVLAPILKPSGIAASPQPLQQNGIDTLQPLTAGGNRLVNSWRISVKKQISGPFDIRQMAQLALNGKLGAGTNVLANNAKQWTKVHDWPELLALFDNISEDQKDIPLPPDD